jgi:hypothetical protein
LASRRHESVGGDAGDATLLRRITDAEELNDQPAQREVHFRRVHDQRHDHAAAARVFVLFFSLGLLGRRLGLCRSALLLELLDGA